MKKEQIIAAIEACSTRSGLSAATITGRAVGNTRLYARMKAGGGCTLDVASRLLDFIAQVPSAVVVAEDSGPDQQQAGAA